MALLSSDFIFCVCIHLSIFPGLGGAGTKHPVSAFLQGIFVKQLESCSQSASVPSYRLNRHHLNKETISCNWQYFFLSPNSVTIFFILTCLLQRIFHYIANSFWTYRGGGGGGGKPQVLREPDTSWVFYIVPKRYWCFRGFPPSNGNKPQLLYTVYRASSGRGREEKEKPSNANDGNCKKKHLESFGYKNRDQNGITKILFIALLFFH